MCVIVTAPWFVAMPSLHGCGGGRPAIVQDFMPGGGGVERRRVSGRLELGFAEGPVDRL